MNQDQIDHYKRQFNHFCTKLDRQLNEYPVFEKFQESTNVRPSHACLLVAIILAVTLCLSLAPNALVNIIGFVHPAYYSFHALETKTDEDDRQWLTYWIVFAFFNVVESVTDVLMHWIPFYYLFKVVFIIWLSHPTYRGAGLLLDRIAPIFYNMKELLNPQPKNPTLGDSLKSLKKDIKKDINIMKDNISNIELPTMGGKDKFPKFD